MAVVNVIMRKRTKENPRLSYVTVCMAGHCGGKDYIMQTSGTWDATKFDLDDKDAELFCNYLNDTYEDEFEIVPIDTRHLAEVRHEYWSDAHVHCSFKIDHLFKGILLQE